jgi:hypothetical protein
MFFFSILRLKNGLNIMWFLSKFAETPTSILDGWWQEHPHVSRLSPCLVCRSPLDGYAYLENRPGNRRLEVLTLNGKWWKHQLRHGCFKRSVPETWHGNHMKS